MADFTYSVAYAVFALVMPSADRFQIFHYLLFRPFENDIVVPLNQKNP